MSRRIKHMVPTDGTEHETHDCYCHPDVIESNAGRAALGLTVEIAEADSGALTFVHHKSADNDGRWQEWLEHDDV